MSARARNRVHKDRATGKMVGLGGPGGKGIVHKPKDKKGLYNPKRQAVRDFVHDAERMQTKSLKRA